MNEREIEMRQEIWALKGEVRALKDQLEGNIPDATVWLQTKVWRQAKVLTQLNTRITNQRFQLRTLNELGRGLSVEEFLAAKAKESNAAVAERLEYETVS